jgi:DNA repair MmcB-like protein
LAEVVTGERQAGDRGERAVALLLEYEGWSILEYHPFAHGHRLDLLAKDPDGTEWLIEVKVWVNPRKVGTDNVKKAIGDAWDLRAAGETRPYLLALSHSEIGPLHIDMISRALALGAINAVRVLGFIQWEPK